MKKSAISTAVALGLGISPAFATEFFITYMDFPGAPNSTVVGTVDTAAGTGTFTSGATPFFGHAWTATVVAGFEAAGADAWNYSAASGASATGTYNFTLAPGQVAMGVLFSWGTSSGIPMLNIMNADGSGVDIDGDGYLGTVMAAGPFAGSPVGFAGKPVIPLPEVAIEVPGGVSQECQATNGSEVIFSARVTVSDPGEIASIHWFMDGGGTPVASGEDVIIFVPVGVHTMDVMMNTLTQGSVSDSVTITVQDTVAPAISASFSDARTGNTITSVSHREAVKISVHASDLCDPAPETMSTFGLPVRDSDTLVIRANRKDGGIAVTSPPGSHDAELRAVAKDASGNTAVETVVLPVSP